LVWSRTEKVESAVSMTLDGNSKLTTL